MKLGTLLELYCDWNGQTKINDDNLNKIVSGKTAGLYETRKDLLDREVVSFDFIDNVFIVRVR